MAYVDQAALAIDPLFRSRIKVALMTLAAAVAGEPKGTMNDNVYGKRQSLASSVIRGADQYVDIFAWMVTTDAALTAASTDVAVQAAVNAAAADVAGIRITD